MQDSNIHIIANTCVIDGVMKNVVILRSHNNPIKDLDIDSRNWILVDRQLSAGTIRALLRWRENLETSLVPAVDTMTARTVDSEVPDRVKPNVWVLICVEEIGAVE